ncbi:MAG TPA: hypothetical protein VD994_13080, partial [Prosthecobacter sp.]|nr:hypothetical protein [Prosthecobacter sp.]
MKPEITAINPKQIDTFWGLVSDLLKSAADRSNHYTVENIYAALKEERAYLWIVHTGMQIDAAVVARL